MAETFRIVLDAMGGDYAPDYQVEAAVQAAAENPDIRLFLTGIEEKLVESLKRFPDYPKDRITVVPASEVIENSEPPVAAVHKKKDSSLVKGMMMVKHQEADAFVSSGSTGAVLVGGQVLVGRAKGVERPPLAPLIPTNKGAVLLIDCGATVDARPSHLLQFARMGSIYMESVVGVKNPRVAIVNIGAEEEKGNALVKETFPLLKKLKGINFIGSIEARDIPYGMADVVVCEAFVGNIILKLYEGLGTMLLSEVKKGLTSTFISKFGALLAKPALKKTLKNYNMDLYGGAPLLGLKGLVVKTHGSANVTEVKNAILQCIQFSKEQVNEKIASLILEDREDSEA